MQIKGVSGASVRMVILSSCTPLVIGLLLFDGQGKETVGPKPAGGRWYSVVEGAVAAQVVLVSSSLSETVRSDGFGRPKSD
jgi:hypothetical protein